MVSLNPYGVVVSDLSVISQSLNIGDLEACEMLYPAVRVRNEVTETSQREGTLSIAVESAVSVDAAPGAEEDPVIEADVVVGCTVTCKIKSEDVRTLTKYLQKSAVQINMGFARSLIYQQTATSIIPGQIIIPPLVFDEDVNETK